MNGNKTSIKAYNYHTELMSYYNKEKQSILGLSLIFSCRMLGLFMILPVFSLYGESLKQATPALMGVALGIYGLTQALFQIPLSLLSDRFGRKPLIGFGLVMFALGSVIAAFSHSIYGVIIGRALQGSGAVGSVVLALLADLVKVENRTKAMAIVGMSIGLSFMVAMVAGPVFNDWLGLSGLFWIMGGMAIFGIGILYFWVPSPPDMLFHKNLQTLPSIFKRVLSDTALLRLDIGIFIQHAILTASFLGIPIILSDQLQISVHDQWRIYLPVLLLVLVGVFPLIILAEKRRHLKGVFLGSIMVLSLSEVLLCFFHLQGWTVIIGLFLFFFAFTLLESFLPSMVSKIAPIEAKGTAMGVYSTSQFLGIFLGGSLGGVVFSYFHLYGVFLFSAIAGILWLCLALGMKPPPYLSTQVFKWMGEHKAQANDLVKRLMKIKGVSEALVILDEQAVYLKVDKQTLDTTELKALLKRANHTL